MKNKLALILMFAIPYTTITMDKNLQDDIKMQVHQLKRMLAQSSDAYINHSTPMHKQSLTLHWYLNYFIPFRLLEGEYAYNSEVLLTESKKLSDVILAMEQLQTSDVNYDYQVNKLIKMLINSNEAYIHNTPMYQQSLTLQWVLGHCSLFRIAQGSHCYNAEITLNESKKLVDVITAMTKFKTQN